MIMTHTRAKYQAQKLLGSKATVERDGRADTTDRITLPGNTVGIKTFVRSLDIGLPSVNTVLVIGLKT